MAKIKVIVVVIMMILINKLLEEKTPLIKDGAQAGSLDLFEHLMETLFSFDLSHKINCKSHWKPKDCF